MRRFDHRLCRECHLRRLVAARYAVAQSTMVRLTLHAAATKRLKWHSRQSRRSNHLNYTHSMVVSTRFESFSFNASASRPNTDLCRRLSDILDTVRGHNHETTRSTSSSNETVHAPALIPTSSRETQPNYNTSNAKRKAYVHLNNKY